MSDDFTKVQAGQRLRIPAAAWNACLDAAADFKARQMAAGVRPGPGDEPGNVLVRNDTGGDLDQFAVVRLDGVVIAHSDSHEQFVQAPIFKGVAPTAGCFVAVLQEPIRKDGVGRALVSGITPVQVFMTAGSTTWAAATTATAKLTSAATGNCRLLWSAGTTGDQWAVVYLNVLDPTKPVLCKTTGAPTNGEYPVDLYENGKNEASTGTGTLEVLSLNLSEALPTGTWIVAHRGALDTTPGGGE